MDGRNPARGLDRGPRCTILPTATNPSIYGLYASAMTASLCLWANHVARYYSGSLRSSKVFFFFFFFLRRLSSVVLPTLDAEEPKKKTNDSVFPCRGKYFFLFSFDPHRQKSARGGSNRQRTAWASLGFCVADTKRGSKVGRKKSDMTPRP